MAQAKPPDECELLDLVGQILDENREMAIGTVRPDGWPQVTLVGFVHEDLALYFAIARDSQKFINLSRDPRASIAIGRGHGQPEAARGLSMAAIVSEVTLAIEIEHLNGLIWARYPEMRVFAPRSGNSAVMRAQPSLISLVDDAHGLRQPILLEVSSRPQLHAAGALRPPEGPGAAPGP